MRSVEPIIFFLKTDMDGEHIHTHTVQREVADNVAFLLTATHNVMQ
jgi:hypothetical protein